MSTITTPEPALTTPAEPRATAQAAERIGRLRRNPAARRMLAETLLRAEHLVYPLFVRDGLRGIREVAAEIDAYPAKPPVGQWDWAADARQARRYAEWITTGWPRETRGFRNPYGGVAFPVP